MNRGPFPCVRVSGNALERGRQYGEAARERIGRTVDLYMAMFAEACGISWESACDLATEFMAPIEAYSAKYLEELRGIADGAGLRLADVLAINVRTEVKLAALARQARAAWVGGALEGCTSLAATPHGSADEHTLLAQNWDWYEECQHTVIVLEAEQPDAPNYVTVVEAGLLAKTGLNQNGVGVVTNLLASDRDMGVAGIPYHILLRSVLDAKHAIDAFARLQAPVRTSSANYVVGDVDGVVFVAEGTPGDFSNLHLGLPNEHGVITHTNNFTSPWFTDKDVGRAFTPDSPFRLQRAQELMSPQRGCVSPASLQQVLANHFADPCVSICLHPTPGASRFMREMTVASVVMDLDERTVWIAAGPPCSTPYRKHDYSGFLAATLSEES